MSKSLTIQSEVSKLPKVGEKRSQALNKLGIETVYDLLQHYPFRYEDFVEKPLDELMDKEKTVLSGEVLSDPIINFFGPKRSRLSFRLLKGIDSIVVTFFNQHWLSKQIHAGDNVIVFGVFDQVKQSLTANRLLQAGNNELDYDYEPIYPSNKGISQKQIRQLIEYSLEEVGDQIPEYVPESLKEKYQLISHQDAIHKIHFPKDDEDSIEARREIKFEEAFIYQIMLQDLRQKQRVYSESAIINYDVRRIRAFIQSLPFEPTNAQKRVINEICADFMQPVAMQRLLQGDVGSGKTLVAAAAMAATASAGSQSALMAPTEILAEQHYQTLTQLFEGLNIKTALLTGSTSTKDRNLILEQLASGEIQVIVGTHALIQDDVIFNALQFAITDEQHRFGVNQRQSLEAKGEETNSLQMTATPIPRTLSITTYGTVDVSIIDELPKGRQPIQTHWVKLSEEKQVLNRIHQELADGGQVYIISPLIDESDTMDLHTATTLYEKFQKTFEPTYEVGLLHGQMKNDEKEMVMQTFKNYETQLLISTTVIEVGVDVPRASLMVIYDAERFGLAQLHQLRGRVGRGSRRSECILLATPKTENGRQRMQLMTASNDGFYLSEKDLEMRGPGDLFGKRQSGLPEFKMLDIATDFPILESARNEASTIYYADDFKTNKDYALLNKLIQE